MSLLDIKFGRRYNKPFENIGLRQLREQREATVERWSRLGLLDGLVGQSNENIARLFESQTSYIINEDINNKTNDIPFRFR
jgi:hypothetical protein